MKNYNDSNKQECSEYQSSKDRMRKNHRVIYIIGSIGIAAASVVLIPKIIDELSNILDAD